MTQKDIFDQTVGIKTFRYFFMIFLLFGAVLAATIGMLYIMESKAYLERVALEEKVNITLQRDMISTQLEATVSDLWFLSRQNELLYLINRNGEDDWVKDLISDEYLEFSRKKGLYDQIRYIDATGMEIVRVNFNAGQPAAEVARDLQSKADRYYFKETMTIGPDDIFVSPFDLNVEQGKIEMPLKPMIRFAVPVFSENNQKQGIIVLNYLGARLIASIRESAGSSQSSVMLVNGEGYWLLGPDPDDEWGFMIPERDDRKFSSRFPEAWRHITASDRCQIHTPSGLFTAATIYPLKEGAVSSSDSPRTSDGSTRSVNHDEYYWKVITHISPESLDAGMRGFVTKLCFLAFFLSLMAAIPSWLLARGVIRRKSHQMALYHSANYDRLTKLPNRTLFMDRLNQVIKDARRYRRSFALMFIDLDDLKSVNDALGHGAGDALLVQAAGRLLNCLRESDTVARMGGDEFTVILPTVDSPQNAHRVARKIIETLNAPFSIPGHAPRIGASIGISLFPDDGTEADILLKKADDAMYQAKKNGKNDYQFFTEAV